MGYVDYTNVNNPHSKGAVTVNCVFLEISVHFVVS